MRGDFGGDHVGAFAGGAHHEERRMQGQAGFDKAAHMVGVGYGVVRTLAVVERVAARDLFGKQRERLDLRACRADQQGAGVVLKIKRRAFPAFGDVAPAAFGAGRGCGVSFAVGGGFGDGARPAFLDLPVIEHTGGFGQIAGEGAFAFDGALEFDEADEGAPDLGGGEVVQQPLLAAKVQAGPEARDDRNEQRAGDGNERGIIDHGAGFGSGLKSSA